MTRPEPIDFAAFVAARGPDLLRSARLLCSGDHHRAEDMLQTALARAYPRWSRIAVEDPEPYIRRALVNLATDWWRSPLSRVHPTNRPLPEVTDSADAMGRIGDWDVLRSSLARLSRRERAVLVMRFYWDLSEQQTAAEMGCPVGTVKSMTARALLKVRQSIGQPARDPGPAPGGINA